MQHKILLDDISINPPSNTNIANCIRRYKICIKSSLLSAVLLHDPYFCSPQSSLYPGNIFWHQCYLSSWMSGDGYLEKYQGDLGGL